MATTARLERPGASEVIGVLFLVMALFSLLGLAISIASLEMLRADGAIPEDALSLETQLFAQLGLWIVGVVAGVLLIRGSRMGPPLLAAVMVALMALGYLVQPDFVSMAISALALVLVLVLIYRSTARAVMAKPALWVTIIASLFLMFASFALGAAAFAAFFVERAPQEAAVDQLMIWVGGAGVVFWLIGAAVYKFRWPAAIVGWPLLGAGLVSASFAAALDDASFAAQFGVTSEEVLEMANRGLGGGVASALILVGLALVFLQTRREARQREEDQTAIQEAFR